MKGWMIGMGLTLTTLQFLAGAGFITISGPETQPVAEMSTSTY